MAFQVERHAALRVVQTLLQHGYSLSISDGVSVLLDFSIDVDAIFAAMFTTDENWLITHKSGQPPGWVHLVYFGVGWDVIRAHTSDLSAVLANLGPPPTPDGEDHD